MKLVAQYRQFAAECRKLAADTDRSAEKQRLESMARAWERMPTNENVSYEIK